MTNNRQAGSSNKKKPEMTKLFCILISALLIFTNIITAYAEEGSKIENLQIFGSEPMAHETDKGRNLLSCLAGWRQFIAAGLGYENFSDYWTDLLIRSLWPLHFSDIMNVEGQLNRTRYAVMAAFLRCDLERLKSVSKSYYRLEAELYFVRHYVDTSSGYIRHITKEGTSAREDFANKMVKYLFILKPAENEDDERSLYMGYFDMLAAKYSSRAEQYAHFSSDSLLQEVGAKFDELIDTFKSFKTLGSEMGKLGEETAQAVAEGATAVYKGVTALGAPANALSEISNWTLNRFKICPYGDAEKCKNIKELTKSTVEDVLGLLSDVKKAGERKTFEDVKVAVTQQQLQKTEDEDKGKMLSRYELLYGQVSGEGVAALMGRLDKLIAILGKGSHAEKIIGSFSLLDQLEKCADEVQGNVCM